MRCGMRRQVALEAGKMERTNLMLPVVTPLCPNRFITFSTGPQLTLARMSVSFCSARLVITIARSRSRSFLSVHVIGGMLDEWMIWLDDDFGDVLMRIDVLVGS